MIRAIKNQREEKSIEIGNIIEYEDKLPLGLYKVCNEMRKKRKNTKGTGFSTEYQHLSTTRNYQKLHKATTFSCNSIHDRNILCDAKFYYFPRVEACE